jgi:hypothetical protein
LPTFEKRKSAQIKKMSRSRGTISVAKDIKSHFDLMQSSSLFASLISNAKDTELKQLDYHVLCLAPQIVERFSITELPQSQYPHLSTELSVQTSLDPIL